MSLARKFSEHPATVGETYGEHFVAAMGFSFSMIRGALCCAIHALVPFWCEKHGSEAITRLHDRMVTNRSRLVADRLVAENELGAGGAETSA